MLVSMVEFCAGAVLAALTLYDVVETVIVPGANRGTLRVTRRVVSIALPIWKRFHARGCGIPTGFAPFALVTSFFIWMAALCVAFGMMAHVVRDSFRPELDGFAQALYVAGSAMVTTGTSGTDAVDAARWVVLAGGFCGLSVMTMAVTYLIEVQSSIAARDAGILKLMTATGRLPSGLQLLERYAQLGCRSELREVLRRGRDWCASTSQSHVAQPSLIYFRSISGSGWPAALGALLDTALIVELLLDEPGARAAAVLMREQGTHMARQLMQLLNLEPLPSDDATELTPLLHRLHAAGFALRDESDTALFLQRRARQAACVNALARHLDTLPAPLIPERDEARETAESA